MATSPLGSAITLARLQHRCASGDPTARGRGAERVEQSVRWWRDWANRGIYDGPYRDAVMRSALVPEADDLRPIRSCRRGPHDIAPRGDWRRAQLGLSLLLAADASLTLRALFKLGYAEEAEAYLSWILHATRLTWPELQVLYDVFGEVHLPESELPHLSGYANSRPVRVGNDAQGNFSSMSTAR